MLSLQGYWKVTDSKVLLHVGKTGDKQVRPWIFMQLLSQ